MSQSDIAANPPDFAIDPTKYRNRDETRRSRQP